MTEIKRIIYELWYCIPSSGGTDPFPRHMGLYGADLLLWRSVLSFFAIGVILLAVMLIVVIVDVI